MELRWEGKLGAHCTCEIEVWKDNDGNSLVIATELYEGNDYGKSITNCAEHLAYKVCGMFSLNPFNLTWIEHYPAREGRRLFRNKDNEVVDKVKFQVRQVAMKLQINSPEWERSSWEEVNSIRRTMRKLT